MHRTLLLALICSAAAAAAQQQSMPDMPGMDMPPKPASHPPSKSPQKPLQMPGDMQHPFASDPAADRATGSLQESEQQQHNQQPAGPGSDSGSLTHPTYTLQEPENLQLHIGRPLSDPDLPAPELLTDAGTRPALTLDDLQRSADSTNPTLAEARAAVARSMEQARQVGLPPNPSIGYSGEHIRGGEYGGGEEGAFLSQTLVLGGKLRLRKDVFRQQAASDSVSLDEQRFRLHNDLQQAFYNALAAQGIVAVRQQLLQVALSTSATTHRLANLGQADAPDILQAEVEAEQAKVDFVAAQRMFLEHFSILTALAGQPDLPATLLAGNLEQPPVLDAESRVQEIVSESPSLRHARQEVTIAEARLHAARRESVPDLKLQAGEWYSGETLSGTGSAAGLSGPAGITRPAGWMSFAQAGIDLPLWNRNQGNTAAASADLARTRADVTRVELLLHQQAEPLAQQYGSARFTADRYRTDLLPRARRAYELYLIKYQSMAAAYPQVLVSQRTLFQLQISYLEALRAEWTTAVALQNFSLSGGLLQPTFTSTSDTDRNLPTGNIN